MTFFIINTELSLSLEDWNKFKSSPVLNDLEILQSLLDSLTESEYSMIKDNIQKLSFVKSLIGINSLIRNFILYSRIRPYKNKLISKLLIDIANSIKDKESFTKCLEYNLEEIHENQSSEVIYKDCVKEGFLTNELDTEEEESEENFLSNMHESKCMIYIQNDDIDAFLNYMSLPNKSINKKVINAEQFTEESLISYCAFRGAVKCFKYLLMNNAKMDEFIISNAIKSGSTEIIRLLEQKGYKVTIDNIECAIQFHQIEIYDWLQEQYHRPELDICIENEFIYGIKSSEEPPKLGYFQLSTISEFYEFADFMKDKIPLTYLRDGYSFAKLCRKNALFVNLLEEKMKQENQILEQ